MNNFPTSARYHQVMVKANQFFIDQSIMTLPIDPFQIIKRNKWGLVTYSELAEEQEVRIEDIISAFQSEDGYTIFDGENYTIAYNDMVSNFRRIRFTLMHEIAHIYLNHLVDFDETILTRSTLTSMKYKVLENEANCFARNTLAPIMVVKELGLKTISDVVEYFGMSVSAAKVRLKALIQDYRVLFSPLIQFQRNHFRQFIIICKHSYRCIICGHQFIQEEAEYCPVCGYQALINKKGITEMIYNGYLLDDNSRAAICPRCDNEHVDYEGDICKICGTFLVNQCASTDRTSETGYHYTQDSCHTLLDGDARYCIKCGNESSYYQQGLLVHWQQEKEEIETQKELEEQFPF